MTVAIAPTLIRLPERRAVQRYFDDANRSVLRWLLVVAAPGALSGVIATSVGGNAFLAGLWGAALLVDLVLIFGRNSRLARNFARELLIAFVASHSVAAIASFLSADPEPGYVFAGYSPLWFGGENAVSAAGMIATVSGVILGLACLFGPHRRRVGAQAEPAN